MGTPFEITGRTIRGTRVVALAGDVDLTTVSDVQTHLDAAVAGEAPRIVVDLTRVTFVDSSFLHSLIRTWRRAQRAGGHLVLVCSDPGIARALDVFGITREMTVHRDVGEAVAALAERSV